MGTINLNVGKVKPIGLDIIKTKPIKLNRVHECTNHYPYLTGLPKINGITLLGNKLDYELYLQHKMDEITPQDIDKIIYG